MKNIKLVFSNGTEQIIKCKHYHKTKEGYLFVLENNSIHFTLDEIKEVTDPFILPSGKVFPK